MSQSVSGDPLNLDAALHEASEDRRVGALMRQRNNRETMTRRAEVIEALVALARSLRQENEQLQAERDHARAEWHRHNERADAARAELADLRAKIAAVGALHSQITEGDSAGFCNGCEFGWPCPTARVLLGSQEPGEPT